MRWNDRIGRRLKLSDLHILLAVAQCGSMAKAARQLAMSHPVVSRAIGELERTLGVRLLERNPHGVELTEFGRAMLTRSHAAFDELRQGVKDIEFLADPTAGEVRIASSAPLSASFVSAVIDRFSRRYPRIIFHVAVWDSDELYRDLRERSVDLLIVRKTGHAADAQFNFESLYVDPIVVTAGVKNPLVRRRRIELVALVEELWALPPPDTPPGSFILEAFHASGLELPRAKVVTFPFAMRCSLLASGRFLTVLPRSVLRFPVKHPFIKELPVEMPIASGPIGILTLKNRALSPVAQLFIACAREVARPLGRRN